MERLHVVAIPFSFRVTCNNSIPSEYLTPNACCHTLLFSGHLQQLKILPHFTSRRWVAIPFSFRVTCNETSVETVKVPAELPYPSLFGSLATVKAQCRFVRDVGCHTLLFSGHLQQRSRNVGHSWVCVAIPFSFRVTCNSVYDVFCFHNDVLPYPSLFGSLATARNLILTKN